MNKLLFVVMAGSVGFLATVQTADAQNCRQMKTIAECMACVQKAGVAGRSGGREFCAGMVQGRDTEFEQGKARRR